MIEWPSDFLSLSRRLYPGSQNYYSHSTGFDVRLGENEVFLHEPVKTWVFETGLSVSQSPLHVPSTTKLDSTHPRRHGVLPQQVDTDIETDQPDDLASVFSPMQLSSVEQRSNALSSYPFAHRSEPSTGAKTSSPVADLHLHYFGNRSI